MNFVVAIVGFWTLVSIAGIESIPVIDDTQLFDIGQCLERKNVTALLNIPGVDWDTFSANQRAWFKDLYTDKDNFDFAMKDFLANFLDIDAKDVLDIKNDSQDPIMEYVKIALDNMQVILTDLSQYIKDNFAKAPGADKGRHITDMTKLSNDYHAMFAALYPHINAKTVVLFTKCASQWYVDIDWAVMAATNAQMELHSKELDTEYAFLPKFDRKWKESFEKLGLLPHKSLSDLTKSP